MKKLSLTLAGLMMVGSMAVANDAENTQSQTVDQSKNPITGTKTVTTKTKKKMKNAKGDKVEATRTDKTKIKTDGTVEQSTDVEADAVTK